MTNGSLMKVKVLQNVGLFERGRFTQVLQYIVFTTKGTAQENKIKCNDDSLNKI